MAKRTTIQLIDDLTGNAIEESQGRTVAFALDNNTYEIDLENKNVSALEATLAPFIAVARKAGRSSTARRVSSLQRASENAAIREWAKSAGLHVGDRGRISEEIRAAYAAAN